MINIAIVASRFKNTFGIGAPYLDFAGKFGRPHLLLPPAHLIDGDVDSIVAEYESMRRNTDVLLLPGGGDVNPSMYGGVPGWFQTFGNPWLDYFDEHFLPMFLNHRIPIFGICRGMQALNVATGGTLHPDMPTHPHSVQRHSLVHKVATREEDEFEVNSLHHQAVSTLGAGFEVVAFSEDGVVEAILRRDEVLAGVQWHPEEIMDDYALGLMETIITQI